MSDKEAVEVVAFYYRNWRGEISKRRAIPRSFRFGVSDYHTERDQWLMLAYDLDKNAEREFALQDCAFLPGGVAAARPFLLEEAARIVEDGFNKEVGTAYRDDGVASKNDKCPHGIWMYEDCEACAAAAIRAAKEAGE